MKKKKKKKKLCVCDNAFGIDHALSCSHGGYLGIHHKEVRDLLGELLNGTCTNVCLEPVLKPIDGEQLRQSTNTADDARLDIKAGGFGLQTDMSAHILTCGYFTPMRAHTATAPWNNCTEPKNRTNAVTTKIVSGTWREEPSHLWCSLPPEVLVLRQRHSSNGWLTSCPRRETAATARLPVG